MAEISVHNAANWVDEYLTAIPTYPAGRFSGRGIVCVAGGIKYQAGAFVLFKLLRELGCTLPIHCYYLGEKERDEHWENLVAALDVQVHDLHIQLEEFPHPRLNGWEAKVYAVLHSPLEEVLLLDADIVPVRNPSFLFDSDEYRRGGAVLWPDRHVTFPDECFRVFGNIAPRPVQPVESGQVLCHKAHCWRELCLTNFFNEHSSFYYDFVLGDKDTFLMAWLKCGQEPPRPPMFERDAKDRCFIQKWFDGQPLFWHMAEPRKLVCYDDGECLADDFPHRERVLQILHQLGREWGMAPPAKTQRRIRGYEDVAGRFFYYRLIDREERPLELRLDGTIGEGSAALEREWWMTEAGELTIAGDDGRILQMSRRADGVWTGCWLKYERQPCELLQDTAQVSASRAADRNSARIPFAKRRLSLPERDAFNGFLFALNEKHHLLVYRCEECSLAACLIDHDGRIVPQSETKFSLDDNVDPRLFFIDGRLFMSTSYAGPASDWERIEIWPLVLHEAEVEPTWNGHLTFDGVDNDPEYVRQREKNWIPWVWRDKLFYTQRIQPHRICEVDFSRSVAILRYQIAWQAPSWREEWGQEFRGSTNPVLLGDGRWLSTFHTLSRSGYYTGFFTFADEPPFHVLSISKQPFLRPEDASVRDHDPNRRGLFPLSLDVVGEMLCLAGGQNINSVILLETSLAEVLNSLVPVRLSLEIPVPY